MDIIKDTDNKHNIRRIRDKELFINTVLTRISIIIKRSPRLKLRKKINNIDAAENILNKEYSRLNDIMEKLGNLKIRAEKEIEKLENSNSNLRMELLKEIAVLVKKEDIPKKKGRKKNVDIESRNS
jgi:hypothetical protein